MIIRIKNLRLLALIGVHDWERQGRQTVVLNADVEFDGSRASVSDELEDTLDYSSLCRRITEAVETSKFKLIEALAGRVLDIIMSDERVQRARVEIDKPKALPAADSTSVEVGAVRQQLPFPGDSYDGFHSASRDGIGRSNCDTTGGAIADRSR